MTRAEIQAALHAYVHREDAETVANELRAIELARTALARQFFPRVAHQVIDLALVGGVGQLPADFGRLDFVVAPGWGELAYESPRALASAIATMTAQGSYTLTGEQLRTDPSRTTVQVGYYATPAKLETDASSSWLSEVFPDVLLWAAIAEQQRYLQDDGAGQVADAAAGGLMRQAIEQDVQSTQSGGAIRMKGR